MFRVSRQKETILILQPVSTERARRREAKESNCINWKIPGLKIAPELALARCALGLDSIPQLSLQFLISDQLR